MRNGVSVNSDVGVCASIICVRKREKKRDGERKRESMYLTSKYYICDCIHLLPWNVCPVTVLYCKRKSFLLRMDHCNSHFALWCLTHCDL